VVDCRDIDIAHQVNEHKSMGILCAGSETGRGGDQR
jgi:hypothetical protein